MLGSPLETTILIGMVLLFLVSGVLMCVAVVSMTVGALQRVRQGQRLKLAPSDPARDRRVRRLMLIAAALTAVSFILSALGQII